MLLPLLSIVALQMPSEAQVEAQLTDGLRTALAHGWSLVAIHGDDDELLFTMERDGQREQHVIHIDGQHDAYRVDRGGVLPKHSWPTQHVLDALAAGGGIEVESDCGSLDIRTYVPGPQAKRAAAQRLVGALLAAADDIEGVDADDDRAVFGMTLEGGYAELHVDLAGGRVIAAHLRKYAFGPDVTKYTKRRSLLRAIGERVRRVESDATGIALVGAKRFALEAESFAYHDPDTRHGCGC